MKIKRISALLLTGMLATSMVLGGCQKQMNPKDVVATLGDKKITVGLANFMAQLEAVTYDSYYSSMLGADMWNQDLSGKGSTLEEEVKSNILDEIRVDYLLEKHMKDYGVSISDDETSEIKSAAKQFMSDNSAVTIKQMGATESYVKETLRLRTIQTKMKAAIVAKADTSSVTDEEAAQRTFSYYEIKLPTTSTSSTESTASTETKNSTKKSSKKTTSTESASTQSTEQKAEALKAYAQTVASDAASDFDGVATKYSFTKSTHSYGQKDESSDSFDQTVLQEADKLTDGQISGAIETKTGAYYVIRLDASLDETATASKKKELITQKQDDYYNTICKGYKKEAKWSIKKDVLKTISLQENTYSVKTASTESTSTESAVSTEQAISTETK